MLRLATEKQGVQRVIFVVLTDGQYNKREKARTEEDRKFRRKYPDPGGEGS